MDEKMMKRLKELEEREKRRKEIATRVRIRREVRIKLILEKSRKMGIVCTEKEIDDYLKSREG